MAKKQFRADLYLPAQRDPDLPSASARTGSGHPAAGANIFVQKLSARLNKPIDVIPDEVMEVLKAHDWPGNIRELQNFIERAVVFSPESVLRLPLADLKQMTKQQSAQRRPAARLPTPSANIFWRY